ncbi:MAG TPA: hypothetical protein VF268_04405 [Gammaproteobacteria bacterium]
MLTNFKSIMRATCIAVMAAAASGVASAEEYGDGGDLSAAIEKLSGLTVNVDCDRGVSLNRVLKKLDWSQSATVRVKGTCREYIEIVNMSNLTLQGLPGATLHRPDAEPVPPAFGEVGVVTIIGSSGITLKDLRVVAPNTGAGIQPTGIAIGHGSSDVRLHNLVVEEGASGVLVYSGSQVYAQAITVRNAGWAAFGIYDGSSVHIEGDSLLESTITTFRSGIHVANSVLNLSGTVIRNMQYGIWASTSAIVGIHNVRNVPGSEVVIENDPGVFNLQGLRLTAGSMATLDARLRIINPGDGVRVEGNSTLTAGNNLEITGSQGHGLYVVNDSHATLLRSSFSGTGSSITGSGRNGIVVVNNSTVELGPIVLSGNAVTDIFCDSRSLITSGFFAQGVVQCENLVLGETEAIP